MKTKVLLATMTAGVIMGTSAMAAPLNDYSAGKVEVSVGVNAAPGFEVSDNYGSVDGDQKARIYGDATVGLGNNLAVQFKYADNKLEDHGYELNGKLQEYNLRYKLNDNWDIYAGNMHASLNNDLGDVTADRAQIGVKYQTPLSQDVTGWAEVGFGDNVQHYGVGMAYSLSSNVDWDLSYQYTKVGKMGVADDIDVTAKGLYTGLSVKF